MSLSIEPHRLLRLEETLIDFCGAVTEPCDVHAALQAGRWQMPPVAISVRRSTTFAARSISAPCPSDRTRLTKWPRKRPRLLCRAG